MGFQQSSQSWRAKAHLGGVSLPALVGLVALAVCVAVAAGSALVGVATSEGFSVTTAEDSGSAEADAAEAEEEVESVYVHVSGAVASPGVYELPADARVQDAVSAAGGFSADASTDSLNLARAVVDGEQIVVPTLDEVAEAEEAGQAIDATSGTTSSSSSSSTSLININTATAEELQELPGIGEVLSAAIVSDREENGSFASIEDITRVSGIGDAKFAAIEDLICV